MKKGVFITGTDTGVGKTYVAAGLARALARARVDVGVMKPAETGCRRQSGRLVPRDALLLIKSSEARDSLSFVNPYRFQKPLAPFVAAKLEGKQIVPGRIMRSFHELDRRHDFMIIEGAGGIMVPLRNDYTYRELALDMGLPVLIVARAGLGTVNHTLLTVLALNGKRIKIAGIVLNQFKSTRRGLAEKTNPLLIEEMCGVPVLGVLSNRDERFDSIAEKLI
jgi:dethiobiotin synthetase